MRNSDNEKSLKKSNPDSVRIKIKTGVWKYRILTFIYLKRRDFKMNLFLSAEGTCGLSKKYEANYSTVNRISGRVMINKASINLVRRSQLACYVDRF